MKKILLFSAITAFTLTAFGQQKNPGNKKEVQDKINQAQQQLDMLTPGQKKMMEQMGMSTKAPSMPTGISDDQVAMAVGGDGVPKRNAELIAAIPAITLTSANLAAYLKTLGDYVEKSIDNDAKSFGQQVYSSLKNNKYDAAAMGNAAIAYWASGQLELAVYIMSRACADNVSDADLQCNFAAMLSMGGAPHRAIPLLEYLNKQYPDNTTIENNLGQAWFYLGETDKANAQLEKVVGAFAYHPQANYTQCLIQESKGNKEKAIEKMKNSLHYSYSMDKVNKLRKLGFSVKGSGMRKPFRPETDPLGLRNFIRPDFPKSYVDELKLSADWDAFEKQINDKTIELSKALIPYQQAANQQAIKAYNQYQKANGNVNAMSAGKNLSDNLYRKTAEKNLEEMNKDGGIGFRLKKAKAEVEVLKKDFLAKDEAQRKSIEKTNSITATSETELAHIGENIGFDNCVVQEKYSEWVYANYNKPLEEAYKNYLHQLYLKITEELYWKQFTQTDADFEASKITAKKEWLAAISARYISTNKYGKCNQPPNKPSNYKLGDFDDMHCAFKSSLDCKVVQMNFECGKSSISFDAGGLKGDLHYKFDDAGNNKFVRGNVEATAGKDLNIGKKGPLEVSATVKAGMGMEISSHGIEDVYAIGEASASAGAGPVNVEVGVTGKMSLISGNMSGAISGFGK